ncbi:TrkA C-terminal domain-containing protein [Paenibacillus sp. S150]|uniref:TrkA C-terminal domain-containing protein n=1 Tax=Paenibacillus sp. S150 TaxID=2749826 RepID=UPI001E3075EC|nr:TrkA C-terminal domain-containing protein [Paenibacillus sp. S150]
MGKTDSEFNHIAIDRHMPIAGMQIAQMGLPGDILFTAIIRNKSIVTPHGNTVIEPGDTVYVLSPKSKQDEMRASSAAVKERRRNQIFQPCNFICRNGVIYGNIAAFG